LDLHLYLLEHETEATNELPGQSDGPPPEEGNPGNIVEVKIRLPETLRHQLAAEASRNKRTLTAEIRARLELRCAVDMFKRRIGQQMVAMVTAAAKNVSPLPQLRKALTADELSSVIEALETAQAIPNPLSGYLRPIRSGSGLAQELERARSQIRTALVVVQRLAGRGRSGPADPTHGAIGHRLIDLKIVSAVRACAGRLPELRILFLACR
jgi:hypothetical protein